MMRKLIWIFPLLALVFLYLAYQAFVAGSSQSSEDVMLEFEEELTFEEASMEGALFKIDLALRLATEEEDRDQQALILRRRAKLYRDLKRNENAREDLKRLLRDFEPGDRESTQLLSRLEFQAGNREEGLRLIQGALEKDPSYSGGLFNRADFYLAMGQDLLDECATICAGVMDDNSAQIAAKLTSMAAARTHTDLRRANIMVEVSRLFPAGAEVEKREYNEKAKLAREFIFNAFADYAEVLKYSNSTEAIASVLKILQLSGNRTDAANFATASIYHFVRSNRMTGVDRLFESLHSAGLDADANRLSALFLDDGRTLSPEFLRVMLRITYAREDWESLIELSDKLMRFYPPGSKSGYDKLKRDSARSLGNLYQGLANYHLGNHRQAVQKLGRYRSSATPELPFPDALVVAEDIRARSAILVGGSMFKKVQTQAHRAVLRNTTEASGFHWRALLGLQRESGVTDETAELSIAHVMAAFPKESPENESLWKQFGRRAMKDAFLSLDDVRRQLNQTAQLVGEQTMSSFAYFKLAEQYTVEREWYGVLLACDKAFESVPYLPPAIRLYLDATEKLGLESRAIDLLIGQLEYVGVEYVDTDRLYQYREHFTPEQRLRLIESDPLGFGRRELIDSLLERGDFRQVLSALPDANSPTASDKSRLQACEALLGLGRNQEALFLLQQIQSDSPHYKTIFSLLLETAIATEDTRLLDSTIATIVRPNEVIDTDFIATLDTLFINGRLDLASKVAAFLDSSAATRSGQNMLRLGFFQLLTEQYDQASETFERVYAYNSDGAATLGNMLIAVKNGEWTALARHLAEFEDERGDLSPEASMILSLLHGRTEPVSEQLALLSRSEKLNGINLLIRAIADTLASENTELLEEFPEYVSHETRAFISGTPESPHDPREILVLLLALQDENWSVWLVREMSTWTGKGSGMWASYISAEALLRLGAYKQADQEVTRLVSRWDQFLPAWELANRLQTSLPLGHAQLLTFAKRGWYVPDHPGAVSTRSKLDAIEKLRLDGELDLAMRSVRQALDLAPNSAPLLYQLGLIHAERGNYETALINLSRFIRRLPKAPRDAVLPEIVTIFDEAVDAGGLTPEIWRSTLSAFSEEFPYNALVAIRSIHSDLQHEVQRDPVGSVYGALKRIRQFKERTQNSPISALGAGAVEAWHNFYLQLDPSLDEKFLTEQLNHDPSMPELWSRLAECLYAQGRIEDADASLNRLLSMVPDRLGIELAIDKSIRDGESLEYVESLCKNLADIRGIDGSSDEQIQFFMARAKANGTLDEASLGVHELQTLWRQLSTESKLQKAKRGQSFTVEVGRSYGVDAMRLGNQELHSRAQGVFSRLVELPLSLSERRLFATLSRIGPHRTDSALPPMIFRASPEERVPTSEDAPKRKPRTTPSLDKFTPEQIAAYKKRRAAEGKKNSDAPVGKSKDAPKSKRAEAKANQSPNAGRANRAKTKASDKFTPEQIEAYKKKRAAAAKGGKQADGE